MGFRTVRIVAVLLVVVSTLVWSRPAHAKAETLKRSVSNVLQAPLDFLVIPWTAGETLVRNYYMGRRHSALEKVMLSPVMAAIYIPSCVFASGFVPAERFIEGAFLLPVGAVIAGTDKDIYLYDPVHGKRGALVDDEPFYFGGRYCEGFFK